jgi:hypothetical protein
MPFDHASCPNCKAILDPEKLAPSDRGPACPNCGHPLTMKDIFGVSDSWMGEDDGDNNLTLDHLVPGYGDEPARPPPPDKGMTLDHLLPGPDAPRKRR